MCGDTRGDAPTVEKTRVSEPMRREAAQSTARVRAPAARPTAGRCHVGLRPVILVSVQHDALRACGDHFCRRRAVADDLVVELWLAQTGVMRGSHCVTGALSVQLKIQMRSQARWWRQRLTELSGGGGSPVALHPPTPPMLVVQTFVTTAGYSASIWQTRVRT